MFALMNVQSWRKLMLYGDGTSHLPVLRRFFKELFYRLGEFSFMGYLNNNKLHFYQ